MDTPTPPARRRFPTILSAVLATSAAIYCGYNGWIGLDPDDSENLETTRVLAASRMLRHGASGLYGPHSGSNPYVLIQAPLYYQMTALLARPATDLGVDPPTACLYAGRLISFASFLACLMAASRLARLGGGSTRSGWWSALLIAGSPIIGSYPVAMRPDMAGIALQTIGLLMTLRVVIDQPERPLRDLLLGFSAFGLAACMKQHYIVIGAFSTCLLGVESIRGRLSWRPLTASIALAAVIVAISYGSGEWLTSGRMSRAVLEIPRELNRVSSGSWDHVGLVAATTLKRSIGLAILASACLWASRKAGRLDGMLLSTIGLELALMLKMCLDSEGAWYNYAMQSVVCASVLIGRTLDRVVSTEARWSRLVILGVASLALLGANVRLVVASVAMRREAQSGLRDLLEAPIVADLPRDCRYFVGFAQHNRRFGRADLAHDEWLYGSYEALGAAEPRDRWLRSSLTEGTVRQVITIGSNLTVPGISEPLAAMGYEPIDRFGPYLVWEREPKGEIIVGRGSVR